MNPETKPAHTPTPWKAMKREMIFGQAYAAAVANSGEVIFKTPLRTADEDVAEIYANTELIVKAVNAYEKNQRTIAALTEVLKKAREDAKDIHHDIGIYCGSPSGLHAAASISRIETTARRIAEDLDAVLELAKKGGAL